MWKYLFGCLSLILFSFFGNIYLAVSLPLILLCVCGIFIWLSVCFSSLCLVISIWQSVCPYCLYLSLPFCLSVCQYVCLSVHLSIFLSACLCLPVSLFLCLCLSVFPPSLSISVSLSVSPPPLSVTPPPLHPKPFSPYFSRNDFISQFIYLTGLHPFTSHTPPSPPLPSLPHSLLLPFYLQCTPGYAVNKNTFPPSSNVIRCSCSPRHL